MLVQILLSREAEAGTAPAALVRTHPRLLQATVFAMNLPFVARQPASVCETP